MSRGFGRGGKWKRQFRQRSFRGKVLWQELKRRAWCLGFRDGEEESGCDEVGRLWTGHAALCRLTQKGPLDCIEQNLTSIQSCKLETQMSFQTLSSCSHTSLCSLLSPFDFILYVAFRSVHSFPYLSHCPHTGLIPHYLTEILRRRSCLTYDRFTFNIICCASSFSHLTSPKFYPFFKTQVHEVFLVSPLLLGLSPLYASFQEEGCHNLLGVSIIFERIIIQP